MLFYAACYQGQMSEYDARTSMYVAESPLERWPIWVGAGRELEAPAVVVGDRR